MDMLFTGTNGRPTRVWGKLGEGFFRVNDTFFFNSTWIISSPAAVAPATGFPTHSILL
jgi:hypothetical protein